MLCNLQGLAGYLCTQCVVVIQRFSPRLYQGTQFLRQKQYSEHMNGTDSPATGLQNPFRGLITPKSQMTPLFQEDPTPLSQPARGERFWGQVSAPRDNE